MWVSFPQLTCLSVLDSFLLLFVSIYTAFSCLKRSGCAIVPEQEPIVRIKYGEKVSEENVFCLPGWDSDEGWLITGT